MSISYHSICAQASEVHYTTKVHSLPIHPNTSFEFENAQQSIQIFSGQEKGHVYSRYANPTVDAVARKIAKLETYGTDLKAQAYLTSSGMSAISNCMLSICESGKRILASMDLYGGSIELLKKIIERLGISVDFVDFSNLDKLEDTIKSKKYHALFFETPTNPLLKSFPIQDISELCKKYHLKSIIDNTFCTSYLQRPFEYGIDFVIYSATKYLSGHGNCTAGVVLSTDISFMEAEFWKTLKLTGGICSPFEAWTLNNGLKTLPLRMDRHAENALQLAQFLQSSRSVNQVYYPFLSDHSSYSIAKKQMLLGGGMLSFELNGGLEAAKRFMDATKVMTNAPTLGDTDTLLLHPYSSSHVNVDPKIREATGITPGLMRISVGLESFVDLKNDLLEAGI